jgi:hypothetical protein
MPPHCHLRLPLWGNSVTLDVLDVAEPPLAFERGRGFSSLWGAAPLPLGSRVASACGTFVCGRGKGATVVWGTVPAPTRLRAHASPSCARERGVAHGPPAHPVVRKGNPHVNRGRHSAPHCAKGGGRGRGRAGLLNQRLGACGPGGGGGSAHGPPTSPVARRAVGGVARVDRRCGERGTLPPAPPFARKEEGVGRAGGTVKPGWGARGPGGGELG